MENQSVASLMVVVGIAFFIPIILQRLNLRFIPVVIAEIIAGLIIGKSGLNIVAEDQWLEILSLLGFIFLMFISGLEIDFNAFQSKKTKKENLPNPLKISFGIFLLIMITSYSLSLSLVTFGLIKEPFLMTLIISTISLGIVVPVLKERNLTNGHLGQTILLITVISDFSTMILLTVYAMLRDKEADKVSLLLVLFLVVFIAYRLIKRYFHIALFENMSKGTIQLGTRGVFALILLFVALSETLGAENILGAFLAGVLVSLLSPRKEFVHQLDSFGFGFLIPIFFVMVGVNLDIQALFVDKKILLLMPLLFIYMYIAKVLPSLILKKWYSWKEVFGVGLLTTSKLSLVIAAAAVAMELGVISQTLNGALILVSILTCLVSPISFSKIFPDKAKKKPLISIIGANSATLHVSLDLLNEQNEVKIFSMNRHDDNKDDEFPIIEVEEFTVERLTELSAFDADKIVLATSNDENNILLAQHAKALENETIIVRAENPDYHNELVNQGFTIYSTLFSTRTLLKSLIDNPGLVQLITQHHESIKEIYVGNSNYNQIPLIKLPFLGDALILHIYRNGHLIIPHGDSTLELGDRLLVSGSHESLDVLKMKFQ